MAVAKVDGPVQQVLKSAEKMGLVRDAEHREAVLALAGQLARVDGGGAVTPSHASEALALTGLGSLEEARARYASRGQFREVRRVEAVLALDAPPPAPASPQLHEAAPARVDTGVGGGETPWVRVIERWPWPSGGELVIALVDNPYTPFAAGFVRTGGWVGSYELFPSRDQVDSYTNQVILAQLQAACTPRVRAAASGSQRPTCTPVRAVSFRQRVSYVYARVRSWWR
jgi:hypothetical protein